jgi:tetratricopeptide (TPR) repeat protein
MMVPVSRQLGKYEIRQKLGRGGMADVYLAQDTEGGFPVALKVIEHSADADTRDTIEAERRGALLQARLADVDPNVVRIFDAGDLEAYFFVAMEYVPGEDLADLLRTGPLDPRRACEMAFAIATTLDHAHNLRVQIDGKEYCGIVHGDIKPKNIRVQPDGSVRVLDFGIAKALSLSRRLTRNDFGSVPYASPERLDLGEVNAHSDLWSLGVTLYEMVAGMQPYRAESTERLERIILSRVPPPPAPESCPEPLRQILAQALDPDPGLRYASGHDFAADLQAFLDGRPVQAASADRDATRRTFRQSGGADDATRRTVHTGDASGAAASDATRATGRGGAPNALPAKPARHWPRYVRRGVAAAALALLLWGGYVLTSNYLMWTRGRQLDREISTEKVTDPADAWTRWTELSQGHSSSMLLWGVRRTIRQQLVASADAVINNYRLNDAQTIYEKDWERARINLAHALELDPGDESIRGRLRLVEGHLARINGTSRRNTAMLNRAVEKFDEAQQLLSKSPDPQLGLARVYVYGLKDIDKAYEALHQAERRGHKLGNREKNQLADGYRDRGDRLWWDSRNVRGLPQEKDQIKRASDDYRRALEIYQGIVPYGNSSANSVRVVQSLDSVNTRLQQLQEGTPVGSDTK